MKRARLRGTIAFFAFAVIHPAAAADPSATIPLKTLAAPALSDWTGFYLGGQFGYATGTSNWVAIEGDRKSVV